MNGQEWPSNFCPQADGAPPWNKKLPSAPANVDANATTALAQYANYTWHDFFDQGDGGYGAWYVAKDSDPVGTFSCNNSGNPFSATIHVPPGAVPSSGTDGQIAIIQPDGTEYDAWVAHMDGANVTSLTCGKTNVMQDGVIGGGSGAGSSATSGTALTAGIVRFEELRNGTIRHALILNVGCILDHAYRYPAQSNAQPCAGGTTTNALPTGAHIYLKLSDTEIDALPATTAPHYLLPVLHALHQYGGYVSDTGQEGTDTRGNSLSWIYEPSAPYHAYGKDSPGKAFGDANGYSVSGSARIDPSGVNWAALAPYLEVLQGCYANGACTN